ncbi:MobA-like NTP transferase protein [Tumebacillus sp. BK434]|uniref:NTP transferase domain-containing protein n=1 Tax=Tumebacillus sp. BK434 TaxID=2512169 RepID=UPI0010502945|nr:NTP transferase domain-containing protein [Tumebacillus sp. BK434]TCP52704.1 MobA-like NTP transferase protein [Tumebacillus sp. BK434]
MDVLVLAGGQSADLPVLQKADLLIGGIPMAERVAAVFQDVPAVRSVRIERGDSPSLVANLLDAVQRLQEQGCSEYLLISSCDIPFLTAEAVTGFLDACPPGADFYYPVVRKEACEQQFPGVRRTYVKLKDGTFTGGNLFLVRAAVLPPLRARLNRLFAHRKRPLLLAREFGLGVALSFAWSALLGTLTIGRLEREAERIAGIKAKAVITGYAEIGTDIDKLSDLALLEQLVTNTKEVI